MTKYYHLCLFYNNSVLIRNLINKLASVADSLILQSLAGHVSNWNLTHIEVIRMQTMYIYLQCSSTYGMCVYLCIPLSCQVGIVLHYASLSTMLWLTFTARNICKDVSKVPRLAPIRDSSAQKRAKPTILR